MTTLTITKTGRVEFDQPINAERISLNAITLYLNLYNLTKVSTYTKTGKSIAITPGYYTYEQLKAKMPGDFTFDKNTLKIKIDGTVTGGLKKLIDKDGFIYLTPLSLYMYVEGIDTSTNYLNGKRSTLLSIIPVGKTDVGEIVKYQPIKNFKKMYSGEINSLNIEILDEWDNKYKGKFVAELTIA